MACRAVRHKRLFFSFLLYADVADRKGKLNSPAASAEILSFAPERILQRGKRKRKREKSDDVTKRAKKEQRGDGPEEGEGGRKKKKDTNVISNAFEY